MTQKTWRVGVAGLGTVGGGLLQFLAEQPDFAPAGDRAVVTAVSARSKSRPRTVDISGLAWFDDPVALAASRLCCSQSSAYGWICRCTRRTPGRRRLAIETIGPLGRPLRLEYSKPVPVMDPVKQHLPRDA